MANQLGECASYGHKVKDLTEDQQARSVVVSKIPKVTQKNSLKVLQNLVVRHIEWVRNGGGKIECIQFTNEGTDAIITFESSKGLYIPIINCHLHEFYGDKFHGG